ncbi:MAG TPA: HDOD domain-containing protein [Longimicrobiaceae bacterium]|nr:HDOD domain-containing protein [Longimicrobiaceae bacterium]
MDLFVARQPIFDHDGELSGYELLYRRGAQSRAADGQSTSQMSLDVITQSFLEIGLDRITRGKRAFINFSRDMLLSGCYDLLDPRSVVIELLEDIELDAAVGAECERLVRKGYCLALDDYEMESSQAPLLEIASIVKVDVLNRCEEGLAEVANALRSHPVRLLAERVETAEVRDACRNAGYELFQGYFFSRPEVISKKGISVEQAAIVQLMNLLRDETVSDQVIEETFRRDPSLSYKLLRMVNAASQGMRGIESILHAIRVLGRATLHRWLALLFASSLGGSGGIDNELVHAAVLRARLCEMLGEAGGQHATGPLFLVGLFSLMDALLGTPMEELVGKIDLSKEVRAALLDREGPYARWLRLVEAYEAGEWETMAGLSASAGISPFEVPELYLESLSWTREKVLSAA